LIYEINDDSKNPLDNIHVVISDKIFVINIDTFMTGTRFENDNYFHYDLREPARKIIHPDKIKTTKMSNSIDDWTKIPFFPTAEKKKEMINEYGKTKAEEIIEYSFNNSVDPTIAVMPPPLEKQQLTQQAQNAISLAQIQQYNQLMQQFNSKTRIIPQNINKFSPAYSRIIAAKPKAGKSANIRLGGVY
jgi:hypothetical protein